MTTRSECDTCGDTGTVNMVSGPGGGMVGAHVTLIPCPHCLDVRRSEGIFAELRKMREEFLSIAGIDAKDDEPREWPDDPDTLCDH